jgi:hypothetical protein
MSDDGASNPPATRPVRPTAPSVRPTTPSAKPVNFHSDDSALEEEPRPVPYPPGYGEPRVATEPPDIQPILVPPGSYEVYRRAPLVTPPPSTATVAGSRPAAPGAARQVAQPPAAVQRADGPEPVRIGLWGAPGSGKTTFIGALSLAIEQREGNTGEGWTIVAEDESLEFLIDTKRTLTEEYAFPSATETRGSYNFTVRGTIPQPRRRLSRKAVPAQNVAFELKVDDRPGGHFIDDAEADHEETVKGLVNCNGLVYLYDPLNAGGKRDPLAYFQGTLARIASEVHKQGRFVGAKLPHYVAVCVTKFDDLRIFRLANRWGMVNSHPVSNQPCVLDRDAARFFDKLCEEMPGTAEYVRDAIRSNFLAERVRYYVVASVGYYSADNAVNWEDTTNSADLPADEGKRIRSTLRPVNVVEPIIDLERMIRRDGSW